MKKCSISNVLYTTTSNTLLETEWKEVKMFIIITMCRYFFLSLFAKMYHIAFIIYFFALIIYMCN